MSTEQTVKIKIKKDGSGKMSFECEGFIGEGCNIIKDIETALGTVTKTEANEEAHLYETPLPIYNDLVS